MSIAISAALSANTSVQFNKQDLGTLHTNNTGQSGTNALNSNGSVVIGTANHHKNDTNGTDNKTKTEDPKHRVGNGAHISG